MKNLFLCFIISVLAFALCSCDSEEMPEMPQTVIPEKETEFVQTEEPEGQPEKKTEIKEEMTSENAAPSEKTPEKAADPRIFLTEKDEPMPKDITGIIAEMGDSAPTRLSAKQRKIVFDILRTDEWIPADDYEPSAKCLSGTVFNTENKSMISVNFIEDKTLVLKKWGENQKYRAFYYAPKEVAFEAELFNEKLIESEVKYSKWEDVEKFYPEYDKILSYFGSGLNEEYDEENYISETPYFDMIFDHVMRIENGEEKDVYSGAEVEELIGKYYLWSADEIRNMAEGCYDTRTKTYSFDAEYGGAYPIPRAVDVIRNGNMLEIYVDLHNSADGYQVIKSSILTVSSESDGNFKYISNKVIFDSDNY